MDETGLELLFRVHYHQFDQDNGPWNGLRVRNLCNLLKLNERELARFIRMRPHQLEYYVKQGKFPGCVKLILDILERSSHNTYLGEIKTTQLFPSID